MNIIELELTEQEAKIYDEVMKKVEETAMFLADLSPTDRQDWLRAHQYPHPISFEREIGGTVYTVNAHFSKGAETADGKVNRILNQNITL